MQTASVGTREYILRVTGYFRVRILLNDPSNIIIIFMTKWTLISSRVVYQVAACLSFIFFIQILIFATRVRYVGSAAWHSNGIQSDIEGEVSENTGYMCDIYP